MNSPDILPLTWASNIEVEKSGQDLIVGGIASPQDEQSSGDLFRSYRDWALDRTTKRSGLNAPHIRFANAKTDQQLITFVKRFGPIWAGLIAEEESDFAGEDTHCFVLFRAAKQSLEALHREQRTYAAALDLLAELDKGKKADPQSIQTHLAIIVEGCEHWTAEWQRERAWRRSHGQLPPSWHFDRSEWENLVRLNVAVQPQPDITDQIKEAVPDKVRQEAISGWVAASGDAKVLEQRAATLKLTPEELAVAMKIRKHNDALAQLIRGPSRFHSGHQVICALANAFRTEVTHFGSTRCEAPPLHALLFGVRPVLYHLLRLEYLHTPKTGGAHRCANEFCRQFFLLDREGQKFCSEECSRKQRQRDYWQTTGSKRRRKRRGGRKR
jgi:hypothetical protein